MYGEIGDKEVAGGLLGVIIAFALIIIDKYLFGNFFTNSLMYLIFGES